MRQSTIQLPIFNYEVPALYPEDEPYIPVRTICEMLGIRADTRIPRWRHLFLWRYARKLPWNRSGRVCTAWCLHLGAIPMLYSCFDWSYVHPPERREQLRQATDAAFDVLEQAQQQKRDQYRRVRRMLFLFLTKMAGASDVLLEAEQRLSQQLPTSLWFRFGELVARGGVLIEKTTTAAQRMLHEQGKSLIADVIHLDEEGHIIDTSTMPLFPVDPREEDIDSLLASGQMLIAWYDEFSSFLRAQGLPPIYLIQ
ncbi:MAG TPA: hypothetical protein VFV38_30785 [Ktedonobacteraceae bacterium]|nr:hypothetical protein [Ktedonobacteraceae bacterium]